MVILTETSMFVPSTIGNIIQLPIECVSFCARLKVETCVEY